MPTSHLRLTHSGARRPWWESLGDLGALLVGPAASTRKPAARQTGRFRTSALLKAVATEPSTSSAAAALGDISTRARGCAAGGLQGPLPWGPSPRLPCQAGMWRPWDLRGLLVAGGPARGLVKVRPSRAGVRWVGMGTYDVGGTLKTKVNGSNKECSENIWFSKMK